MNPLFSRFIDISAKTAVRNADTGEVTVPMAFSSELPYQRWWGVEVLDHTPGAIRLERLKNNAPVLFNHDPDRLIGSHVGDSVRLDGDKVLRGDIRLVPASAFAKERIAEFDAGLLTKSSIGYRIHAMEEESTDKKGKKKRRVLDGRLFEAALTRAMDTAPGDILAFQRELDTRFGTLDRADDDIPTYQVTDWEPYENSLVTIPADDSVGVGRAANPPTRMRIAMPTETTNPPTGGTPAPVALPNDNQEFTPEQRAYLARFLNSGGNLQANLATAPAPVTTDEAITNEHSRIEEIEAMCKKHNVPEETRRELIKKRTSVADARGVVMDLIDLRGNGNANFSHSFQPDLTEQEKNRYSIVRMLRAYGDPMDKKAWQASGFEQECSRAIAQSLGKESEGFYLPLNIGWGNRSAYDTGASGTGGALVMTQLLPQEFIDVLRNKARVLQLGARTLSGLVGNVNLPKRTAPAALGWVTEDGALAESEGTFTTIPLTPHHAGFWSYITRQMLLQSTPAIEALVRDDMMKVMALGVDLAALSGTGLSGQPTGIANTSGIGAVANGTNGGNFSLDLPTKMLGTIALANAEIETTGLIGNAKVYTEMMLAKSTTGQYLWTDSPVGGAAGSVPGYFRGRPFALSNQARYNLTKGLGTGLSELFAGDFSELIIGMWGVLEIVPNPYDSAAFKAGGILYRVMQTIDVAVRQAGAFCVSSDIITPDM